MRRLFRAIGGARPRPTTLHSRRCAGPWRVESLEPRTLLAFAPLGPEFRANTTNAGNQAFPAVAADADGDFVVAWTSGSQGVSEIFAQRYNAGGVPQGGEVRVNTTTGLPMDSVAIACDADGDFVIAWTLAGPAPTGEDIFARRFGADGVARGGEFRVNATTASNQRAPSIALDADGDFVIAWTNYGVGVNGILARRYNAAGVAQGGDIHVFTPPSGVNYNPAVALDADGDFVIGWQAQNVFPSVNQILARRYDSAGVPQGAAFNVSTFGSVQKDVSVASDADGDLIFSWTSDDASGTGIYARQYSAAGVAQGSPFPVNTATSDSQGNPSVAADADGDFTVAWHSFTSTGSGSDIYGRRFSAAGTALGNEFLVPTTTTDNQTYPSVAADADGDVVIAWGSRNQDGDAYGIYAQRFDETTDTAGPIVSGVVAAGDSIAPTERLVSSVSEFTVHFSENLSTLGGPAGANSPTNPANWRLTRNGADVSSVIQSITFGFNAATNKHEAVLTLSSPQGEGSYVLTAKGNLRDLAGNPLDGNLDGAPGGDSNLPFVIQFPVNVGPEFRVNTFTSSDQKLASVAADADGDFVIAWASNGQDGSGYGIYAQRYSAAGAAQGGELSVNTTTTGTQWTPSVAADAAGNFVVAWSSFGTNGLGIYAQRYNAAGARQGGEFPVNTAGNNESAPSVAMDADGDFVVAWNSFGRDGSHFGIYAQRYNAAGVPQGGEFPVNTFTAGEQSRPSVAAGANGNFVVAWTSNAQDGASYGIYAQRYSAAGVPQGGEFPVNTYTASAQYGASVSADDDGDFVIAWASLGQDANGLEIYAQRYDAAGAPQGGEFHVNTTIANHQSNPSVSSDADGDFVIAWGSNSQDGSFDGVHAQRFSAAGVPQGGEFRVNTFTTGSQSRPSVASDADGDFVVAWDSEGQDGSAYGVYAQRYRPNERPTTLGLPSVTVAEDEADTVISLRSAFSDSTDPAAALAFTVTGNTNPSLFTSASVNAANGTLTLDYAPDQAGTSNLTVRVTDTAGLFVESTFTVSVNPVNDAPVNTVPGQQIVAPGDPVVFGRDNPITVSDVDVDRGALLVTLQAERGYVLALALRDGLTIEEEQPNFLRFLGRIADINRALGGLSLTPEEGSPAETMLTITTDDRGNTGAGGALSDTDVIPILFDKVPSLSIDDAIVTEGHAGTAMARFTVRLSGASDRTIRVSYATADGTATAASGDYQSASGVLEFRPGEIERIVTVLVNGDSLSEGDETFAVNLSNAQNARVENGVAAGRITDDDAPAHVTAVFVAGSAWSTAFKNFLAARGLGEAAFGYSVPAGAAQFGVLPWSGTDRISMRFDRLPPAVGTSLQLRGVNVPNYLITGFVYDEPTHTGTWSLAAPIVRDKLMLDLDGPPGGLDGDWTNGADAFPSGDGTPGGDFRFRLNILTGDVNRDGRVSAADLLDVRRRLRRSTASPGAGATEYTPFHDLTADGSVGTSDEATLRRNFLRTLPPGEPTAPAAAFAAGAARRRAIPVCRGIFGDQPIIT